MPMRYYISRRANQDIEEIGDFIAKDNVDAATRLNEKIHESIKLLSEFPRLGHVRADVRDECYRFWSVGKYLIAYRIDQGVLEVVRVVHGARDIQSMFG
jgi:plasmid stabilization system protein ParE